MVTSHRALALTLAAVTLPALATAAAAASLVPVGTAGAVTAYVDKDSIRRNGSQVRAALEWRWSKPAELPDNPAKTYRLERQVQLANCANKSYAVVEGTHYADERGSDLVSSYASDEKSMAWLVPPARTIRANVVSFVCEAAPALAPKKP